MNKLKIALEKINDIVSNSSYANEGDSYERRYSELFKDEFPNTEIFWKYFVVPSTNRIDKLITNPEERIRHREGISNDIKDLGALHYSMFMNLIYANHQLEHFELSSFENFYTHLGTTCDLAEEVLMGAYFLILECTNRSCQVLQELSKDEFLRIAATWYECNYKKIYEHYLKKGKPPPFKLPSGSNVLEEYYANEQSWKQYKGFSQRIREYRNVIVHNIQIARIFTSPTGVVVPRKEKIQTYKKWSFVFAVRGNSKKIAEDFIDMKEQMNLDIVNLMKALNDLWVKPLGDLKKLFYEDRNERLMEKYNIELS